MNKQTSLKIEKIAIIIMAILLAISLFILYKRDSASQGANDLMDPNLIELPDHSVSESPEAEEPMQGEDQ